MCALVLVATSHEYVRRALYTIFYTGHIAGTVGFYVFGVMHTRAVFFYCAPASVLWAAELARRSLRLRSAANVTWLGDGLARVELTPPQRSKLASLRAAGCGEAHANISRGAAPIRCCSLAARSHPYSVIECADGRLVAYVRAVGVWSKALVSVAGMSSAKVAEVPLVFDGLQESASIGATGTDEELLLIGGGTGVVPLLAFLHKSYVQRGGDDNPASRPRLVIAARCVADVEMLEALPAHVKAEVTVYHKTGEANNAAVRERAEAALDRRGPGVTSAASAGASAAALALCTHAFALFGLVLGFRISFELPQVPTWAQSLAAMTLLNGFAVAFSVATAHVCVWLLQVLSSCRRGRAGRWWYKLDRTPDEGVELSPPTGVSSEDEGESEEMVAHGNDSATAAPAECTLRVVDGRADIPAVVKAFAASAALRGAKARVMSGGGDSLVEAVATAAASCGVEAREAVVRLHTV